MTERNVCVSVVCNTQFNLSQRIKDELFLHNTSISNQTSRDCTWRPVNERQVCPDPDVRYVLYSKDEKEVLDSFQSDWLRQSNWDPNKEDVFIIHGYAGGDDTLPIIVLRDGKFFPKKKKNTVSCRKAMRVTILLKV